MLLDSFKVTNARGSVLEFPFEDPSTGFVVKNIDGLGPVKANMVSSAFAGLDGEQYHSSRRQARNLVLTLGLEPDYAVTSVQALRDQLYDFFMPKSKAILDFHQFDKFSESILTQERTLNIEGRIESCDPVIFVQDPIMDISLLCFDPDFVDLTPRQAAGATVSNLTENIVSYDGTVDTGVVFTLRPNRSFPDFTIFHRPPDGSLMTIDFAYPLVAGDVLEISSVPGSKYVKVTRAGVQSSILYAISPQSGWLTLQPGDNRIRVYESTGAPIPYTIDYTDKYGGI